jgi:hypothetical protein
MVMVVPAPAENVGHAPITAGRFGGIVPPPPPDVLTPLLLVELLLPVLLLDEEPKPLLELVDELGEPLLDGTPELLGLPELEGPVPLVELL